MSVNLHFICDVRQKPHWFRIGGNEYSSGNWAVSEETANAAVGNRIYLHDKQDKAAWHGGKIKSWQHTEDQRRIIFAYELAGDFRVRQLSGWGQEKAIVDVSTEMDNQIGNAQR